ncbi:hypothetical protein BUALT_Bualt18G0008600 [Buddleja alternifolia]|uniref:Tyrosine-protein phosphatase domain-containing protein n=1 Tax=Buddleja alternifolia TaxID=168488 RepID=A0AAV6W3Q7_9LAMI|nr:hypothetical protein BUALT_Bualt18G0008600 [Buddleja alternifolia]
MRKRDRENPCGVCGHYHKYEEGEVCGICGHRMAAVTDKSAASSVHVSAFPSEILPEFLYLGSYDNAARAELLKTQGISRTVPACQNLYKNSFTYHCLQYDQKLPFDDAIQFLEQCEKDRARVLVHCMSGKNSYTIVICFLHFLSSAVGCGWGTGLICKFRSPAIVMAYLMKSKGWKLAQSYQWVKEHRPSVELNEDVFQQLQEYEQKIFGSTENTTSIAMPSLSSPFSFGFSRPNDPPPAPAPAFFNTTATSIFSRAPFDIPPQEFTFGANKNTSDDTSVPAVNDVTMGGS